MTDFRSRIWPMLASHCAQPSCHGGPNAGGDLRVLNVQTRNERVDYTNFLILDSYTHGGRKMINRDRPEDSILLQYGLPPEQAEIRHPSPLKQTMFRDRRQRNYRQVIEWIRSLDGPPHPGYGVKLRVPWARQRSGSSLPDPKTTTQPKTLPPTDGGF
jgi:hypothetical protein